ncbi:Gnk2-homologous domain [Dillenia turbinata]|uniref:Gnk2-homologous domain n=1 Tax=Dillenia turbinata TaxID=194707 RepID=A0AAN8USU1_9MAGN
MSLPPALFCLLCFTFILIFFPNSATSQSCSGLNFTTNDTYGQNRDTALTALYSNVTSGVYFYYTTVGEDPDIVYALALCRGDYSAQVCSDCIEVSKSIILSGCPDRKEAVTWGPGYERTCIVRNSDLPILNVLQIQPMLTVQNGNNVTNGLDQFNQLRTNLMNSLVVSAVLGNTSYNVKNFATGNVNFSSLQSIYGMVQCTPDIGQTDCTSCLYGAINDFQSCCGGLQGGSVLKPSCFIRSDVYPFYAMGNFSQNNPYNLPKDMDGDIEVESLQYDIGIIKLATNDFSSSNKLGQGGFGVVYKGRLPCGQEIAVKRLSANSLQGEEEFKNEVLLAAKLQHRNLVRLLGFCLHGKERLLIYEYLPNRSLDQFIFDRTMRANLDWEIRYKIIGGIARGLLYLHEDSRLRIIHRDLKTSNILLDMEMNPKISDFGMARLFDVDQTQGNTTRIVGTYGYMAPEYAVHGQFSVKSDVYSFGVLVLEIVGGQKNNCFSVGEDTEHLLSFAWRNWREGTALNLVDPAISNAPGNEIMRYIHIGLLCVQENIASRPTMASVVLMLNSYSTTLPVPSQPAFLMNSIVSPDSQAHDILANERARDTINESSITELQPR